MFLIVLFFLDFDFLSAKVGVEQAYSKLFALQTDMPCCKQNSNLTCYESACCIICNTFATPSFVTFRTLKTAKDACI